MRLYRHRINSIAALELIPTDHGIEFDLRSDGDRVIVTHDPFTDGERIEDFFPHIGSRPAIFNVKCEGVESRVLELARQHDITDFFFLDCSVPAAVKLNRAGCTNIAVRYSEIEPIESALAWKDRATWVWIDCFARFPGSTEDWARLAAHFRLCLVSPELQGHDQATNASLRAQIHNRTFHAVCTKHPDTWTSNP